MRGSGSKIYVTLTNQSGNTTNSRDSTGCASTVASGSTDRDAYISMLAAEMRERDLQAIVGQALTDAGWTWYHTHDSRRSNPGMPDIVALRGSRLIWRELKDMKGRLTTEQKQWKLALETAGQNWALWRPDQWYRGDILREIE